MAIITRRFQYKGPWPLDLQTTLDPGAVLPAPGFVVTYDLRYDDTVASAAVVDERMRHFGCFPEPADTRGTSPTPFIGAISPDGSIWKLQVDNLGIITTVKVA